MGDGPHHFLLEIDVLQLDIRHLDTPGVGLLVEDALDIGVEPVALGQHLVGLVQADDETQRGLRELVGRLFESLNL